MLRGLLIVALLCGSCAGSRRIEGYWVRAKDAGKPTDVWMHLGADGTFEMHWPEEVYRGTYTTRGQVVQLHTNYDGRCELQGDALSCGGEGTQPVTLVRSPRRPPAKR